MSYAETTARGDSTVLTDFIVSNDLKNRGDGLVATEANIGLRMFENGWRGIAGGIVWNLFKAVTAKTKYSQENLIGFIGPGICQTCYEVDEPVLSSFPWRLQAISDSSSGKAFLDLSTTIASLLGRYGMRRIVQSAMCTACDPRLHSHRKQGLGVAPVLEYSQCLEVDVVMKARSVERVSLERVGSA